MKSGRRRGPAPFEIMNKAPKPHLARRQSGLLARRPSALSVAEPVTEAQAAAELAAELAEVDASPQPSARARLKSGWSDEMGEPAADGTVGAPQVSGAKLVLAAGAICAVLLVTFSLGRRYSNSLKRLPPAAAIAAPEGRSTSPLLPAKNEPAEKPIVPPASAQHPDLSHLLSPPPKPQAKVTANKPARVEPIDASSAKVADDRLYLQIESFLVSRTRSGDHLVKDLADVRRFLSSHGIETIARRRGNGYILLSKEGFAPGATGIEAREAFRKKVRDLGQAYRKTGGLYQFKGCLFVSSSTARSGDPA